MDDKKSKRDATDFGDPQKTPLNQESSAINRTTTPENTTSDKESTITNPTTSSNMPRDIQLNHFEIKEPVVLLIGPQSSGKTVTLIRLARLLNKGSLGYDIKVNRNFISDFSSDKRYEKALDNFHNLMNDTTNQLPAATQTDSYLLLNIRKQSRLFGQILEAPGEDYFSINKTEQSIPAYLATILNHERAVIFTFLFERKMLMSDNDRTRYDQRMAELLNHFDPKRGDQFILIYNKIDQNPSWKTQGGDYDENQVIQDLAARFPALMQAIDHICTNSKRERFFTIFSSGTFTEDQWIQGPRKYPERLWGTIEKAISKPFPWIYLLIGFLCLAILLVIVFLMTS